MSYAIDLYVLAADLDQEQALKSLLANRSASLGIREIRFETSKHPRHDAGCRKEGVELLRTLQGQAAHALLVLDHEGCGDEASSATEIEAKLDRQLATSGWGERARAMVIEPEIEAWIWSGSPRVDTVLGWAGRTPPLRQWLERQGHVAADHAKPKRPKEAFRAALHESRVKPSAALFADLARTVSLDRCADRTFLRLREFLASWFPRV
jgi:hypothetical protein